MHREECDVDFNKFKLIYEVNLKSKYYDGKVKLIPNVLALASLLLKDTNKKSNGVIDLRRLQYFLLEKIFRITITCNKSSTLG